MSTLIAALEKLDRAIVRVENALDSRIKQLETQQRDLFSQLDDARDHNKMTAQELNGMIATLETLLKQAA